MGNVDSRHGAKAAKGDQKLFGESLKGLRKKKRESLAKIRQIREVVAALNSANANRDFQPT